MNASDLPEKWERKASELWPDDRDYPIGACSENPAADDAWRLRNCAAELRAALPEQPLAKQWREEASSNDQLDAQNITRRINGDTYTLRRCAADLESQRDRDRELLAKAADALDNHGFFEQKLAEKIRNHLGGESK